MRSYVLLVIVLTVMVFGQTMSKLGSAQPSLFNVFVVLGYSALILRGVLWAFALKNSPISVAYPFLSLSFVLVLAVSYYLFDEQFTVGKIAGSLLIIAGVLLTSLSKSKEEG